MHVPHDFLFVLSCSFLTPNFQATSDSLVMCTYDDTGQCPTLMVAVNSRILLQCLDVLDVVGDVAAAVEEAGDSRALLHHDAPR